MWGHCSPAQAPRFIEVLAVLARELTVNACPRLVSIIGLLYFILEMECIHSPMEFIGPGVGSVSATSAKRVVIQISASVLSGGAASQASSPYRSAWSSGAYRALVHPQIHSGSR